jgi:tubulin--tyrosine ligase-like protein 12
LDESSCWYINDEFGSSIPHSNTPKVKIIPFLYAPSFKMDDKVISYSLMWPLEDLEEGDLVTRDFLNGIKEEKQRSDRLAAWFKLPQNKYLSLIQEYDNKMLKLSADSATLL